MPGPPRGQATNGIKARNFLLTAHDDFAAFVQQRERGALYSVRRAAAALAVIGVNGDQVIMVR